MIELGMLCRLGPGSIALMGEVGMALILITTLAHADIAGVASVIDGDTLEIRGQRIRLHGTDTPESGQTCVDDAGQRWRCGQQAALALRDLIGRRTVTCDQLDVIATVAPSASA